MPESITLVHLICVGSLSVAGLFDQNDVFETNKILFVSQFSMSRAI